MIQELTIILGSNLGDRELNLQNARTDLEKTFGNIVAKSSVYESEPWGYNDSESYYNQVVRFASSMEPEELLFKVLDIERKLGRVRNSGAYEARIIDIDILFYGNHIINTEHLILPHPRIQMRKFVLIPLCEIEGEYIHPQLFKSMNQLLTECTDNAWVKKIPLHLSQAGLYK